MSAYRDELRRLAFLSMLSERGLGIGGNGSASLARCSRWPPKARKPVFIHALLEHVENVIYRLQRPGGDGYPVRLIKPRFFLHVVPFPGFPGLRKACFRLSFLYTMPRSCGTIHPQVGHLFI
jgi:hypothetical protein